MNYSNLLVLNYRVSTMIMVYSEVKAVIDVMPHYLFQKIAE